MAVPTFNPNSTASVPTPAIIFLCVVIGFIVMLFVVYQCLKAGMCCKTDPEADRPDEKDYKELNNTYETETDEDYLGPPSKPTSRRSSFGTTGSKSDGEIALGDSASVYGYNKYSDSEYSPATARRALSAYGETVEPRASMSYSGDEVCEPISVAGKINISVSYFPTAEKLAVTVMGAQDIPTKQRGGASTVQVRVVLLPSKRQRFKTKAKPATNPNFHETFTFSRISQEEIHQGILRFRLYGHERIGKDKLIGELNLPLTEVDMYSEGESVWKTLTPRSNLGSSDSVYDLSDTASIRSGGSYGSQSSLALTHGGQPELLVSLCYQSLTGRLTVEVLKASNLRTMSMQRAPDTYVKVTLLSPIGRQIAKSKTTIRRSMVDPEYNESFVFEISEKDLAEVTVTFSVISISKTRKKKDMIGWFSLGRNYSGQEEIRHWNDMIQSKEQPISCWHALIDA